MIMRVFKCSTKKFEQAASSAHRFSQNEDGGAFTIFVLLGFVLILATAGIGVDIMNFERDRASLQGALDRAVLAAANVKQELPPKDVVIDYIEKSNVRGELSGEPVVETGIGSRKVTAYAEVDVKTHFMHFFGYPKLTAKVGSVAEESLGSIEISLVLDISGSMGWDSATQVEDENGNLVTISKLAALQDAAVKFVDTMYLEEDPDKISISIIPYNNQVNAGPNILNNMSGVTNEHNYSHCVNFTASDFEDNALNPAHTLKRTAHFDRKNYSDDYDDDGFYTPVCTTRAGSSITPVTNVISDLHDQINAMTAGGNTSIDIGVKWGAALLDPQFRSVISALSTQNVDTNVVVDPETGLDEDGNEPKKVVPAVFNDRPETYDTNVQKILIVMTDGENTENWELDENLRAGSSDVWVTEEEFEIEECWYNRRGRLRCRTDTFSEEYSVKTSDDPLLYYWTRHGTEDNPEPYGGDAATQADGQAIRLTYPELWSRVNLDWNAAYNYAWQSNNNTNWYSNAFTETYRTVKDDRLEDICDAIKAQNVDVYSIAFEAPSVGVTAMDNCSSGAGYFYKVEGGGTLDDGVEETESLTIEQVFQTIAVSIKQLRLTQ